MSQLSTQPYKGTRDFFPHDMRLRAWIFERMRGVVQSYGYSEYNGPLLEPFELYAAKTGEEIVNQQLYWLMDRGERKMAIRPEMTPTLARMVAQKIHELPRPIRWYSIGNFWRYERPQRGRLREFWQLNVDVLGGDPNHADAEILQIALAMVRAFGGESRAQIRVNNRRLMDGFFKDGLGVPSEVGLKVSKAVDARAKIGNDAYAKWLSDLGLSTAQVQKLEDFFKATLKEACAQWPSQGTEELEKLFKFLEESGVRRDSIQYDPTVMRGLDYYTGTVFELYDQSPENRRAMFGGGRYDDLVGLFGNQKISGMGFGMGDVTLQNFLETHALLPNLSSDVDVMVSLPKAECRVQSEKIARSLREAGLRVITSLEVGGFGVQLKLATRHQAQFVVLLGEQELAQGKVAVKELATGVQSEHRLEDLAAWMACHVKKSQL